MFSINTTKKNCRNLFIWLEEIPDTRLMNTIIIILIGIIAFVVSFLIVKFIRRISNLRSQIEIQHLINSMNLRIKRPNVAENLDGFLPQIKFEKC